MLQLKYIPSLDAEYNVDNQKFAYVYQVVNALNKYNKYNQKYIYASGATMSLNTFENNVANSLTACRPVILHARTEHITYYGGHSSGHYISLDYINRTTDMVRLVDCNYSNVYYGIHSNVDLSDAYDSIASSSGRYLIY